MPARTPFQMLALAHLHESPTNPRRTWGDLSELVESIRSQGVLQPVLARPATAPGGEPIPGEYELVFGHRRYRAAKEAGLVELPALVRKMSDVEVLEAQLIENAQRQDIHPLEEAEALQRLHEQHGHSVENLAARTGKSKAAIYARLKLCALGDAGRQAMYEGALDASRGLLIARIPDARLQAEATKKILAGHHWADGPLSYREAQELIRSEFMLELEKAAFSTADATLVKAAGACTTCPRRTGAQPELFADVKGADVCIDLTCYRKKEDAHWKRRKALAEEAGQQVLTQEEVKRAYPYGDQLTYNAPWVELKDKPFQDPKRRTVEQLLKKASKAKRPVEVPVILARTPSGEIRELIPRAEVSKLLQAVGVNPRVAHAPDSYEAKHRKQLADERKQRKALQPVIDAAIGAVIQKVRIRKPDETLWRVLAGLLMDSLFYRVGEVCKRRGIDPESGDLSASMNEIELRGLVFELAMPGYFLQPQVGEIHPELKDLCRDLGVDLDRIAAQVAGGAAALAAEKSGCLGYEGRHCSNAPGKNGRCRSCSTRRLNDQRRSAEEAEVA